MLGGTYLSSGGRRQFALLVYYTRRAFEGRNLAFDLGGGEPPAGGSGCRLSESLGGLLAAPSMPRVPILLQAATSPILSLVRWYGTDGTAKNQAIASHEEAARFASQCRR